MNILEELEAKCMKFAAGCAICQKCVHLSLSELKDFIFGTFAVKLLEEIRDYASYPKKHDKPPSEYAQGFIHAMWDYMDKIEELQTQCRAIAEKERG